MNKRIPILVKELEQASGVSWITANSREIRFLRALMEAMKVLWPLIEGYQDERADDGDGYYDTWESRELSAAKKAVRDILDELEKP